jgi:DNA-binding transcriptional MerR regulator
MRYSIGELARRTGLTVKAVRFYSDRGLVPPSGRTSAGHRHYDSTALARLGLIRTLRELGLDLATIRRVVDGETDLPGVAAAHAEALAVQLRVLRLRHAVLTAVAKRGSTPEETSLMHELAQLSDAERRRLIDDFLGDALGHRPDLAGIARTLTPELPENPDVEQVEAWIELAELTRDAEFRAILRWLVDDHRGGLRRDLTADVRDAIGAGIAPGSPEAAALVDDFERQRGPGRLRDWLAAARDPRRERYLRLLAIVNGWAAPESLTPVLDWLAEAAP